MDAEGTDSKEEDAFEAWAASDEPTIREDAVMVPATEEGHAEIHDLLVNAATDEQKAMIQQAAKTAPRSARP